MRLFVSLVAILLMVTAATPRLQAQTTHAAPQSALDAAVQQHVDTTAADREAVLRVLGHSEVKAVAERTGIDLRRATGAVSTLQGEDLARVAAQAQQVENALAGGQSRIVISTTLNRITHWETSDHIQLRGKITADQYVERTSDTLFAAQTVAETALQGGAEVVAIQVGTDVVIYTDVSAGASIHNAILLAGRTLADIASDNFV